MEKSIIVGKPNKRLWFVIPSCFLLCFILLSCLYSALFDRKGKVEQFENITEPDLDPCTGQYIYVHDLPSRFNKEIVSNCSNLLEGFDMCKSLLNSGMGPQAVDRNGVLQNMSWFKTNQFVLEVIFHNRMNQYKCLVNDSSLASAIYVPFYAGLDVGRYLWRSNASMRDSLSLDLVKWLVEKPEWKHLSGRDHFFVAGRVFSDFKRVTDDDAHWGSKLLSLPETKNMTMLTIESNCTSNQGFAVPYPTSFHPSSESTVFEWQNKVMSREERRYLFAFVGAPRPCREDSIRGQIINQCLASKGECKLLNCRASSNEDCDNPVYVMEAFQDSTFCLQPPGDTFTRRSTFDSIMAGCIPVFFRPESAYMQYMWHLPDNYTKYSVFIPEDEVRDGRVNIEEALNRVSKEDVLAMRKEVVRLIPEVMYANPRSSLGALEDAFDVAVKRVLDRIETIRKEMKGERSNRF